MKTESTIKRRYIISQKELKKKLGIKGEITDIDFGDGRSPKQIEQGIDADVETYYFDTQEVLQNDN